MNASSRNQAALDAILNRRSISRFVEGELPSAEELDLLLRAAATVPDHGTLRPYRFVVVQGEGRDRFGEALVGSAREQNAALPEGLADKLRKKAFAAPTQILLIAAPKAGMKIPEWEQIATASCTGYAIALAAFALGLGAIWKSAPILEGAALGAALQLQPGERLLGWVNVGRPSAPDGEARPAVEPASMTTRLGAGGLVPLNA